MKLRGDHCQCPTCGLYFNSTSAFDKHRAGRYIARRCLTVEEMQAKGMAINSDGWWLGSRDKRAIPANHAITGAAIGTDPLPIQGYLNRFQPGPSGAADLSTPSVRSGPGLSSMEAPRG